MCESYPLAWLTMIGKREAHAPLPWGDVVMQRYIIVALGLEPIIVCDTQLTNDRCATVHSSRTFVTHGLMKWVSAH